MKLYFGILIFIFSIQVFSQVKVDKKLYAKDLKNADLYFDTEDYLNAIYSYKKVLAIEPFHEMANLNSAIIRIKLGQPADSSFANLVKLKTSKLPEVQFYFGQLYHLTSNFDEAINSFNNYKAIPEKQRSILNEEIDYQISCSKNAKEFVNSPHRSIIKNIGNKINSIYADYVPLIFPDESYLYFTSRRDGSTGNLKDVYGNWANFPVAIFYTEKVHPEGSNYFGMYLTEDKTLMITNGIKATEQPFSGVMAKNGDVIYSRYRHDHRTSDDGSVFVDGGRDYFRSGVYAKEQYVSLRVNKDKLEAFKND